MRHPFIRLRPRPNQIHVSQGRSVWITDERGLTDAGQTGLFVHETRMISRHRLTIDGYLPHLSAASKVSQHAWMAYYIFPSPACEAPSEAMSKGLSEATSEQSVELRFSRFVGSNVHEDLDLVNFAREPASFTLALELGADFADQAEVSGERSQRGELDRSWAAAEEDRWELTWTYRARNDHPGGDDEERERPPRCLERGLQLVIHDSSTPPRWDSEEGRLCFEITLQPHERWHCCLDYLPRLEAELEIGPNRSSTYGCGDFETGSTPRDKRRDAFLARATSLLVPDHSESSYVVKSAYEQATADLASLRLSDLDVDATSWTMAAGLPLYVALFGRDTLTASWQAALLDHGMLHGTLVRLSQLQGRQVDDWRDEQPGRLLHEAHTGPLELLGHNPRDRYYGSITTSAFFPVALCELWHWTGDLELVRPLVPTALRALEWLDRWADLDDDGLYEYLSRSSDGVKHQAWKDSSSAMVYEDGRIAEPPIATCEEQGFIYMARLMMAELAGWLGELDLSERLLRQARELEARFCDAFWMADQDYLAMALDPDKRPLRSIASNAGHCLATGIVDDTMVEAIADRLMSEELFSGWGVRTLSKEHPAYNPYSYHRGSVWPVENATFALGFARYGLHDHMHRLCRAQFQAAALFETMRLPEVFSGHGRDRDHPFPAFYPNANAPQAWSSSTIFTYVQAMCGIYPYAPLKMLLVDPHLPEWLPELTLDGLQVGDARVTLSFRRDHKGKTHYRVERLRGTLHVLRQPSPWSHTATTGERLRDAMASLLPGR